MPDAVISAQPPRNGSLSVSPWMLTAEKITKESDSAKLTALVAQLCKELDAERRA